MKFPVRAASPEKEGQQHPLLAYEIERLRRPGAFDEHNPNDLTASSDLDIRQMRATYYGLVNEVDYQLGHPVLVNSETTYPGEIAYTRGS